MAEFCLDCWNKINDTHLTQKDVIISEYLDFCEECGEMTCVIIRYKKFRRIKRALRRFPPP